MSVSSTSVKAGPYSTDGIQQVFNFAYKAFSKADVRVVLTTPEGVESDLVLDVDYSVTLTSNQNVSPGGYISTPGVYALGHKITIVSNQAPTQLVNVTNFRPDVIELALDKLTLLYQQTVEQLSRAVKVDISSAISPSQLLTSITQNVAAATLAAAQALTSAAQALASATQAQNAVNTLEDYLGELDSNAQNYINTLDENAQAFIDLIGDNVILTGETTGTASAYLVASAVPRISDGQIVVLKFHVDCAPYATVQIADLLPILDLLVERSDGSYAPVDIEDIKSGTYHQLIVVRDGTALLLRSNASRHALRFINSSGAIPASQALDSNYVIQSAVSLVLPPLSAFKGGSAFTLTVQAGTVISRDGSDLLSFEGSDVTSLSLRQGTFAYVIKSGSKWLVLVQARPSIIKTPYSAPYTAVAGETLQLAHGLGYVPTGARLIFECITADADFLPGERVVSTLCWNGTVAVPNNVILTATSCLLKRPNTAFYTYLTTKAGGNLTPTAGRWRYYFEVTL